MSTRLETAFVPAGQLETRESGGRHELEGLCVPFDQVTVKAGPQPEMFVRGAFAEIDAKVVGKIRLTDYNHSHERRPVGVATVLEERAPGLWGRFRFYDTPEGRSAYENVREETYGGLSIGFYPRAEEIRGGIRTITSAALHHVSLVDEPAYDDARIVSVRSALQDYDWLRNPHEPIDVDDPGWLSVRIGSLRPGTNR